MTNTRSNFVDKLCCLYFSRNLLPWMLHILYSLYTLSCYNFLNQSLQNYNKSRVLRYSDICSSRYYLSIWSIYEHSIWIIQVKYIWIQHMKYIQIQYMKSFLEEIFWKEICGTSHFYIPSKKVIDSCWCWLEGIQTVHHQFSSGFQEHCR